MTDQEIFDGIAQKDNNTFLFLYQQHKDMIINMVKKNNGTSDDALDIFQEGVIVLWANIREGNFKIRENARIGSYLYALCKNIWISKLRKNKHTEPFDNNLQMDLSDDVDEMEEAYAQINKLEKLLGKLGDNCQKLLNLFYYQKSSLKEIAEQMGITEKTAKNNKYRCMQNLRTIYNKENPEV